MAATAASRITPVEEEASAGPIGCHRVYIIFVGPIHVLGQGTPTSASWSNASARSPLEELPSPARGLCETNQGPRSLRYQLPTEPGLANHRDHFADPQGLRGLETYQATTGQLLFYIYGSSVVGGVGQVVERK